MNATGPKTGAWLVRHALEQLPVSHTFGIPGVHNTEIYDELGQSETIHPVLVSHECGAAFMGDAQSRTGGGRIGVLLVTGHGDTWLRMGLTLGRAQGLQLVQAAAKPVRADDIRRFLAAVTAHRAAG